MTGNTEDYGDAEFGLAHYGGQTTTQNHLPSHFVSRLQDLLELAKNHQTLRFITAWIQAEGGTAKWNPLNTTLDMGGQWTEGNYNSTGVKNYRYAIVGIVATALTLSQRKADGSYTFATLLNNLKNPNLTAEQIVNNSAADINLWGTSPTTMLNVLKTIS